MQITFTGAAIREHRDFWAKLIPEYREFVRGMPGPLDTACRQAAIEAALAGKAGITTDPTQWGGRVTTSVVPFRELNWSVSIYERCLVIGLNYVNTTNEVTRNGVSGRLDELLSKADALTITLVDDAIGMSLVFNNCVWFGARSYVRGGNSLVNVEPLGERVASREGVALFRDGADATKLRWGIPGRMGNGPHAIYEGVVLHVSPPFVPDDLLPCSATAEDDCTSFYWHPRREKIKKLNNIAAPHSAAGVRTELRGLPGHEVVLTKRYSSAHNAVIEEFVITGTNVPRHSEIPNKWRRRILSLNEGEDENVALTSAYLFGLRMADRRTHRIPTPEVLSPPIADTHIGLEDNSDGLVAVVRFEKLLTSTPCNDTSVVWDGDTIYKLVATLDRVNAGAINHPSVLLGDLTRYAIVECPLGLYLGLKLLRTGGYSYDSEGNWYARNGDYLIKVQAIDAVEANAKIAVQHGYYDPSNLQQDQPHNAERQAELVSMLMQGKGIQVDYYGGSHYTWLESWGPSPYVRVYSSHEEDTEIKIPLCGMEYVRECAHCGEKVWKPRYENVVVHMHDGSRKTGAMCHVCFQVGNGEGATCANPSTATQRAEHCGFYECNDCSELFYRSDMSSMNEVCEDCLEANYSTCDRCEASIHTTELVDGVCRSCRQSSTRLREYNYSPALIFHRTKPEEAICYGVEIELEAGHTYGCTEEVADAANRVLDYPGCKNFLIAKRDGSLQRGAEFVSQPFSWEWFKENQQRFTDIFARFKDRGFKAAKSCGLHIHATRKPHSELEEFRLYQLVYGNPARWLKASRRTTTQYCKIDEPHLNQRERIRVARERGRFADRYIAMNPTEKNTLEWRIWSGVDTTAEFTSALAMSVGAHHFVRNGATGVRPSWDKFAKFLSEHADFGAHVATRLALATA